MLASGDAVQEAQLPSGLFAGGSALPTWRGRVAPLWWLIAGNKGFFLTAQC